VNDFFRKIANITSESMGSAWAFIIALTIILIWAISGPIFHFTNTWQLIINTGTTIVTFLMVFLIQNTQNRDNRATHLKLDELIKSIRGARDTMIDIEELTDEQLDKLQQQFRKFHDRAEQKNGNKM
jgi:low affinity Fe/Cu permease